jgi:hypothetical protein
MWVGFALVGCNTEYVLDRTLPARDLSPVPPIEATIQTDRITQVTTPVIDALWVIDNSCSMAEEQLALTDNFPSFISWFAGAGLDFHVGVVSTDLTDPEQDGKLREVAGQRWIDSVTPDPVGVFSAMANMGTTGSGKEMGIGAAYSALELQRDKYNAGFYRDEASIHTITITDERDATPVEVITLGEFTDWYAGLKEDAPDRTYSGILSVKSGTAYQSVTDAVGGVTWDITSANWPGLLDALGIQVSGLKQEFFLSALPVPGTILVTVITANGIVQPFDEAQFDDYGDLMSGGWTYSSARNSVSFIEYVPDALSVVELTYELESSRQE